MVAQFRRPRGRRLADVRAGRDAASCATSSPRCSSCSAPEETASDDPLAARSASAPSTTRRPTRCWPGCSPTATDDAEAAAEFRRYTEAGLRDGKRADARRRSTARRSRASDVELDPDRPGVAARLNDVRLALGTRLGVTEDRCRRRDRRRCPTARPGRLPLASTSTWTDCLQDARCTTRALVDARRRRLGRTLARAERSSRRWLTRSSRTPGRPPRRGLRRGRRARRSRPPRAVRPDGERRAVADVLPVRLAEQLASGARWTTATRSRW